MEVIPKHELEIRNRAAVVALVSWALFLLPGLAVGAADYGSMPEAFGSFNKFLKDVGGYLDIVAAPSSDAGRFIEAEFLALFIFRLSIEVSKWVFNHADVVDVFAIVLLGAMVRIFMDFYDEITTILLSWASDVGGAVQFPIVGSKDVFFAVSYINNMINAFTLPEASFFSSIKLVIIVLSIQGIVWLLSIMAFFCMAWGVYGFALAKLVGWFFIPFVLLERTASLFDGWLRYLVGFLVYMVIARVNIVLVLILLSSYLGISLTTVRAGGAVDAVTFSGSDFSNLGGFVALLIISVFALLSTGKFAMAIAGGVGGFGGVAGRMALGASVMARRMAAT
jgi:hypothetical protein